MTNLKIETFFMEMLGGRDVTVLLSESHVLGEYFIQITIDLEGLSSNGFDGGDDGFSLLPKGKDVIKREAKERSYLNGLSKLTFKTSSLK